MTIQKILSYDVYAGTSGSDRYNHVCNVLKQIVDPDTLLSNTLDCKDQIVLTSPRQRATACIKRSSAKSITKVPEFNEITFQLNDFCDEEYFMKNGSSAVRSAFIEAFITNKLGTLHSQLQEELDFVIKLSKQPNPPFCISHTFRMKLIEIYNFVGDELFKNPSCIRLHIDPQRHLYIFGETIEV